MKTESAAHLAQRVRRSVQPVYIVRFYHVPVYGVEAAYQFSVDFSSGPVLDETVPKLQLIERVQGGPAQIVPEQGRASIGGFVMDGTDIEGLMLRYFSNVQLALGSSISAGAPGVGDPLDVGDVSGLPPLGTLDVGEGEQLERIRYSAINETTGEVTVSARGVDDTTAQQHAAGDFVTNGEQIRPGQRCILLSGYAAMSEADYMQSQVVEVVNRSISDIIKASYTIETADITRALRNEVFLAATQEAPFIIGGHPLTIALQVMMSTGLGSNGPYDVLAAENGLGIQLIDVAGIEALRDLFPTDSYCFTITGSEVGKGWLEQEIFKTINCYPVVFQTGRLGLKMYTPVLTF